MSEPTYCQKPDCLGLEVLPEDLYCAWCGSPLLDLAVGLWARRGGAWAPLDPPVLFHGDRRPSLQLRLRHTGQTGALEIRPDSVRVSAPWLELAPIPETVLLHPGEELILDTSRFQKLEDEERHYEAHVTVKASGLRRETSLAVVPLPAFELSLPQDEVTLTGGQPVEIPVVLTLTRGDTTVLEPPAFDKDWATLSWGPEHRFPVPLSARGARVLHGSLRILSERVADAPRMSGVVTIQCQGREASPPQEVLEVRFQESPELVVEPFRSLPRHDWTVVRGATDRDELELSLQNGYQRQGTRAPLEIRGLALGGPGGVELATPERLPRTLEVGEVLKLRLRLRPGLPTGELTTHTLSFDTNELRPRTFHLGVLVQEPRPYGGWLVVDLGTSNTCAALVDERRLRHLVSLEKSSPELRSALLYRRLAEGERDYTVGWTVWRGYLDLARSAVLAAKRKAGDRKFHYDIVPLRDPHLVVRVPVQDVLCDLYRHVVKQAARHLAASGRADLLLTRVVLTHPSRFSSHAIEDLQAAATRALQEHLREVGAETPGLEIKTLHEPVAAALAFLNDPRTHAAVHDRLGQDEVQYRVLVYDAGGGTVDITLVHVQSKRTQVEQAPAAPDSDVEGTLQRILEDGAAPRLLQEVLADLARRRCLEVLAERHGEELPELPDSKGNRMLLGNFAASLVSADPLPALLDGDAARWEALQRSPEVNRQVVLAVTGPAGPTDASFSAQELWPRLAEARRALVQRAGTAPVWKYSARVKVLSASGHARFGGEDMTAGVRDLLVERLEQVARRRFGPGASIPIDPRLVPLHHDLAARSNGALLLVWAESLKVALSEGQDPAALADPEGESRDLQVAVGDEVRRAGFRDLMAQAGWPDRAEVDAHLGQALEDTVRVARDLVETAGPPGPEYVLAVGKCSRWPRIQELLQRAFPASRLERPTQAKECVVLGAALSPKAGPSVLAGSGVSVRILGSGEMTTSRLGIQVDMGGRPSFLGITPAGADIPEGGRTDRFPGLGLEIGDNLIRVLENTGVEDSLQLPDGRPNPDIQEIRPLRFRIPDEVEDEALEDAAVEFLVSPRLHLTVTVHVRGMDPLVFPPIEGTEYGSNY